MAIEIEASDAVRPDPEVDAFVAAHPDGQIYHSSVFARFLAAAAPGTYVRLIARTADGVVGVLPFAAATTQRGTVINSLPWYGSHGGALVAAADVRTALLERYRAELVDRDAIVSTTILTPAETIEVSTYDRLLGTVAVDDRVGMVTPLVDDAGHPLDDDALMTSLHSKTRNLVRKSLSQGFESRVDDPADWAVLEEIHRRGQADQGRRAKSEADFAAMADVPAANRRLEVVRLGDEPAGALLTLEFGGMVEYFVPAIVLEHRSSQPMTCLIWNAMRAHRDAGSAGWNWGGSWESQTSLIHFKERFGGRRRPYRYLVSADDPDTVRAAVPEIRAELPDWYVFPVPAEASS